MIPNLHMPSAATPGSLQRAAKATHKNIERRRAQNRVNAQNSYYRKLRTLEALRTEVASLEKILEARRKDQSAVSHDLNTLCAMFSSGSSIPAATSEALASYRARLEELRVPYRELEQERLVLQELLDVHINFQCYVQEAWLQHATGRELCSNVDEFIDVRPSALQIEALWWVWPSDSPSPKVT